MKQRLSHKVEIQEDYPTTKFIREKVKFIYGQLSARPPMLRTEITVEVANVCYLYVAAINQIYLLFSYLLFTIYQIFDCKDTKFLSFSRICLVYSFSFAIFAHIIYCRFKV